MVKRANEVLERYRDSTGDALMTPFKGVRKDGWHRRRLDYGLARDVLDEALWGLSEEVGGLGDFGEGRPGPEVVKQAKGG